MSDALASTRTPGSLLTAPRVDTFLDQHRDTLMVEAHQLGSFRSPSGRRSSPPAMEVKLSALEGP